MAKADFRHCESLGLIVIELKVKLVVIVILTKANMIDRVGKDTFELHRNIDPRLAVLSDFTHPLVYGLLDVQLRDIAHNLELALEEKGRGSLSVKLPLFISRHECEGSRGQGLEVICICLALGKKLALCHKSVLNYFRVADEREDFADHDLGYYGEP